MSGSLVEIGALTFLAPIPSIDPPSTQPDSTLTRRVIGLAMRVHTRLGPGLLESATEHCLCHECDIHTLPYARQVDLALTPTTARSSLAATGPSSSSTATWHSN